MKRRERPPIKEAAGSAQLSRTAAITLQRVLPLYDLLVAQSFVAAGMYIGPLLHQSGWYGAAAGLGLAVVVLARIGGSSVPCRVAAAWRFWYERHRRKRRGEHFEPFNAELSDGSQIGFHWDGKILMSLVRILEDPQRMTVMEPAKTVSGQMVSAQTLVDCLRQFDIDLDSVDVISQGARSHRHSQIGSVYEAVLGPLPAIARRSVWVVIRMDPTLCPEAVRHRGGGWQGIIRTATTATRRLANRLSDAGLRTRIATADEITQATRELTRGADLNALDETWGACLDGKFERRSYCFEPPMFTTAGLALLWTVPSDSTTVCISLRRDACDDLIKLRGLVRFDGYGHAAVKLRDLKSLPGMQYAALRCSLPLPSPRRSVGGWVFGKGADAVNDIRLPVCGCGQVVGADQHGRAVALPLFGPHVHRVEMCGTLHLAQQVVLRSLALGACVRVHSRRPAAWQAMVDQVGDHGLLSVNGRNGVATPTQATRRHPVEMFDGTPEKSVLPATTVMIVKPTHSQPSVDVDVTMELLDHHRDLVRVCTRSASATVTMVATPDEMLYIKSSLDMVD
ncbi:type VII secretion protein EccE [Mycobacterium sp. 1465703.0]|nr:type VII secretion protein EccE [Mycobacterium sp. 1465703.0]